MMDFLTFVLFSTILLFGKTAGQEIQLQRPMYRVPENISLDSLVLKVCVGGAGLEDQTYTVRIRTEQASTDIALDGKDYIGISQLLSLTGPGADTKCACVEVLEDDVAESTEKFEVKISGSPFITRGTVDAFIVDNDGGGEDPPPFTFILDSPRVEGNQVTFELQLEPGVSATCEVVGHGSSVDCSNGIAQFTLPPTITTPYQPKITIVNSQGQQQTPYEDTNRIFATSSHGRCFIHLINEGISYDVLSRDTTFEWVWTGPGDEGRTYCILDDHPIERCSSPYTISGLEAGPHELRIRVRRGECSQGRATRTLTFDTPI